MKNAKLFSIRNSKSAIRNQFLVSLRAIACRLRRASLIAGQSLFLLASCLIAHASFEELGIGARAVGMGSSFVAISNDASAMYYNPAGLTQLTRPELLTAGSKLYMGLSDGTDIIDAYVGFAIPLHRVETEQRGLYAEKRGNLNSQFAIRNPNSSALGVSYHIRDVQTLYQEEEIQVSYAVPLTSLVSWGSVIPAKAGIQSVSLGLSVKALKKSFKLDPTTEKDPLFQSRGHTKKGFATDVGLLAQLSNGVNIGLAVRNLYSTNMGLGEALPAPREFNLGAHYKGITADLRHRNGKSELKFGYELGLGPMALRMGGSLGARGWGLGTSNLLNNLSLGTGFDLMRNPTTVGVRMDYAVSYPMTGVARGTLGTHKISLTMRF